MCKFPWRAPAETIDVHTDAIWAGFKASRKSTPGGTDMRGAHLIKAWSKTQAVLAKSSAESELYGVVRGACEGLGVNALLRDLGQHEPKVRIHLDAAQACAYMNAKGPARSGTSTQMFFGCKIRLRGCCFHCTKF